MNSTADALMLTWFWRQTQWVLIRRRALLEKLNGMVSWKTTNITTGHTLSVARAQRPVHSPGSCMHISYSLDVSRAFWYICQWSATRGHIFFRATAPRYGLPFHISICYRLKTGTCTRLSFNASDICPYRTFSNMRSISERTSLRFHRIQINSQTKTARLSQLSLGNCSSKPSAALTIDWQVKRCNCTITWTHRRRLLRFPGRDDYVITLAFTKALHKDTT